ncbi:hypothetical protein HDV05_003513 [Chytridiales sp. JEL 0842]|nr:hypothetical protein HDV05_003513 [Chytridiales sp. JEL 0842]
MASSTLPSPQRYAPIPTSETAYPDKLKIQDERRDDKPGGKKEKLSTVVCGSSILLDIEVVVILDANRNEFATKVARSLVLPLTVVLSYVYLRQPSSVPVIASCIIVSGGFITGTFLESRSIRISFTGTLLGVASSLTTALHAIIIKKSLENVKGSTLDLVYYNNLLSALALAPFVVFTGELQTIQQLFMGSSVAGVGVSWTSDAVRNDGGSGSSQEVLRTLLIGGLITGFFGFLINIAGFFQIKVTSPITHMISSAFRGVLQTALAVAVFHDIISPARITGIFMILFGSGMYAWVKHREGLRHPAQKFESEKGGRDA